MGIIPPSGVIESCIRSTEPLEAEVVATAHSAELAIPKRDFFAFHIPARIGIASGFDRRPAGEIMGYPFALPRRLPQAAPRK